MKNKKHKSEAWLNKNNAVTHQSLHFESPLDNTNEEEEKVELILKEKVELILKETNDLMSKLPIEIIFDILARVPIRTLAQTCRWVSKSWFKIISHPRFAQIQHAKALQIFSPCVTYFDSSSKAFFLVDHQVFDNHEYSTAVHHPKIFGFGLKFDVTGSCNGLICMCLADFRYKPQPYFVFNPITRQYINLPHSPTCEISPHLSAFGFDIIKNQYKVVRIMRTSQVEICTLGSGPEDGWRRISDVPHDVIANNSTTFVNGALHWTAFIESQRRYTIVSLDMTTEKFLEIPPPPPYVATTSGEGLGQSVGVLGGCLCYYDADFNGSGDIWVMKTYGVNESWSKEYCFLKKIFPFGCWSKGYEIIKLDNGELLVNHNREDVRQCHERDLLSYYDPKTKVYKPIVTNGIPNRVVGLRPIIHVGSLISPKNLRISTKR